VEFVTFSKEILNLYIDIIINDTIDFEYNNWKKENFFLDMPDKWKFSIALLNENLITGFSINSRKSDIFYIHFFYILKKFRKFNFGKSLLKECEKKAKEYNLQTMQLKCNKNNSSAMSFYLKNGYEIINTGFTEKNLYLIDKKLII